jgi:hypothetical protein
LSQDGKTYNCSGTSQVLNSFLYGPHWHWLGYKTSSGAASQRRWMTTPRRTRRYRKLEANPGRPDPAQVTSFAPAGYSLHTYYYYYYYGGVLIVQLALQSVHYTSNSSLPGVKLSATINCMSWSRSSGSGRHQTVCKGTAGRRHKMRIYNILCLPEVVPTASSRDASTGHQIYRPSVGR